MRDYNYYLITVASIFLGIFLSIVFSEGHFYSFFSLGVFMLLLKVYNKMSKEKLFYYWRFKNFLIFYIVLVASSIIIDRAGMSLNYWAYPQFDSVFDEILKYVFEWGFALSYLGLSLAIGTLFFVKRGFGKSVAFVLSLVVFVGVVGLITEYVNIFSFSWRVFSMPFSNYKIGEFFVVFQTIGYWLMAVIPVIIYKLADRFK